MAKISKTQKDTFVAAVARSIPTPEMVSDFQAKITEFIQQALIELQRMIIEELIEQL